MKIVLIGHPGSKGIVRASKYLTEKYLPGFTVIYLNHKGPPENWSNYVRGFMEYLDDPEVILGLDDYLIADKYDEARFAMAIRALWSPQVHCVKLCRCSPEEQEEYPVTTQYTLWNRQSLISLLAKTEDPWNFEIYGSRLFKEAGAISKLITCLNYNVHSALSSRWEGVRLDGLKEEDITKMKSHGLI